MLVSLVVESALYAVAEVHFTQVVFHPLLAVLENVHNLPSLDCLNNRPTALKFWLYSNGIKQAVITYGVEGAAFFKILKLVPDTAGANR